MARAGEGRDDPYQAHRDHRKAKAEGRRLATLTAYDYPAARLLDECGLDLLLVGDSLGMVVLGHPDTTHVTMDDMIHHTRAVARGAVKTLVATDLPAGSCATPESALENARKLCAAGADLVKIEGGSECLPAIRGILADDCAPLRRRDIRRAAI